MAILDWHPLSCGLGVEVFGLTAEDVLREDVRKELVGLFDAHALVKSSIAGFEECHQFALANAIGTVTDQAGAPVKSTSPGMQYVSNARPDGVLGKGAIHFHHDHLFYQQPLKAIMLYGIEIPPSGSETHFRGAASLYEALPEHLKSRVAGIECKHLYDDAKIAARAYRDWDTNPTPGSPSDTKPWVWEDPKTGSKALLHSQGTIDFAGIDRVAGIELFNEVTAFAEEHADDICTYRHRWRTDDLILWNNLLVAHARLPFAKDEPRTLRRTPVV